MKRIEMDANPSTNDGPQIPVGVDHRIERGIEIGVKVTEVDIAIRPPQNRLPLPGEQYEEATHQGEIKGGHMKDIIEKTLQKSRRSYHRLNAQIPIPSKPSSALLHPRQRQG